MTKKNSRVRRGLKLKNKIKALNKPKLVVFRSCNHIYSQVVVNQEKGDRVIASASTKDKELKIQSKATKLEKAIEVGKLLGKRAKEKEITEIAFDRSGFKYHGRIKALANGAREAGLIF